MGYWLALPGLLPDCLAAWLACCLLAGWLLAGWLAGWHVLVRPHPRTVRLRETDEYGCPNAVMKHADGKKIEKNKLE
jgi:hypothetical protein